MKGEKGLCVAGEIPNQVRRISFSSQKYAQDSLDFLIGQGIVHSDYTVYQCKVCGLWHHGKPEWVKLYSKQ